LRNDFSGDFMTVTVPAVLPNLNTALNNVLGPTAAAARANFLNGGGKIVYETSSSVHSH
jgi:hypothetical protein